MIERIPTGIKGLDALIGGGFIPRKVYLVSGETGTGKTVFGLQYLMEGISHGENGIYIAGDEKPDHLIADAESLGWKFGNFVKEKRLGLLDVSPFFKDMRDGKTKEVDIRTIVADLAKHVKRIGAKRIVIDPIGPLIFKDDAQSGIREYIRDIVFAMEDNLGCTILVTSGIPQGSPALSRHGVAEFICEGVILLSIREHGNRRVRTLLVRKMRCSPTDLNEHNFEIIPNEGIIVREALSPTRRYKY